MDFLQALYLNEEVESSELEAKYATLDYLNDRLLFYTIQQGTFKGVSFKLIQAWHNAKFGGKADEKSTHTRAYIDCTLSVF